MKNVLVLAVMVAAGGAAMLAGCGETAEVDRRGNAQAALADYFGTPKTGGTAASGGSGAPAARSGGGSSAKIAEPIENDPRMDWADPCATNMQEMVGALLVYWSFRNALPASLELMPKSSPTGEKLSIMCPDTGKQYLYYPKGLRAPGQFAHQLADGTFSPGNTLVLVDSSPNHPIGEGSERHNVRLAILMEPVAPRRAVQMYVVPLEENIFQMYVDNARALGQ